MPKPTTSRTLVFHVGDPKTGTSSIQRALSQQLGSHPRQSYVSWREHNAMSVAGSLLRKDTLAREQKFLEIREWLRETESDHAVISSEFLAAIAPLDLRQAVDEFLPSYAHDCRVIAYARPHASRFLAAYIQRIKTGLFFGSPDDFMGVFEKSRLHQYSYRFGRWRRNFGQNFFLRPFHSDRLRNGDIVDDFFRRLFRDNDYIIRKTVVENTTLNVSSLVGFKIMQRQIENLGVSGHLRSIVGGTLANSYISMRQKNGEKLALERDIVVRIKSLVDEDAKAADRRFFKVPFMVPELERAVENSISKAIVLEPSVYFDNQTISEIKKVSQKLAFRLLESQSVWSLYARTQRCLHEPSEGEAKILKMSYKKNIEIDRDLAVLADLICSPIEM